MTIGFIFASLTWITWFIFELWLILRDRKNVIPAEDKKREVRLYGFVFSALVLCILLNYLDLPRIPISQSERLIIGVIIMWAGLLLRWWSIRSLGRHFRTSVIVQDGQEVIRSGPYKLIRHPSYTGALIALLGLGMEPGGWFSLGVMIVIPFIGYYRRMNYEEQMMIASFGPEYKEYMKRTKRIIPFVY